MDDINSQNLPRRTTVNVGNFKLDMFLTGIYKHSDGFYGLRFKVVSYSHHLIDYHWRDEVIFRKEQRPGDVEFEVTLRPNSQDLNTT